MIRINELTDQKEESLRKYYQRKVIYGGPRKFDEKNTWNVDILYCLFISSLTRYSIIDQQMKMEASDFIDANF